MVVGIIMAKVMAGQEKSVYCTLKGKDGILDVYHVFGEYDFFVFVQAENIAKLNDIREKVQDVHHMITVRTILIGIDSCLEEQRMIEALA
jgi:DNA-binding Lrp family transcriptional regulator